VPPWLLVTSKQEREIRRIWLETQGMEEEYQLKRNNRIEIGQWIV
jgi:hypothetical protein